MTELPGSTARLRAGPLTAELEAGALRYIRLGEKEVVRRIYVAVRDERWATIPFAIADLDLQTTEDSFNVKFVAEHHRGPIHFRWRASLRGDARGTIRFQMDGEALATFQSNRIGICVLHPIEEHAGQPCQVERTDGSVLESIFPRLIAPHQPFGDTKALSFEVVPAARASLRFEGEVFETEDQRNWSDASYKTYSTPLARPRPVEVSLGSRISHTVTLQWHPVPSWEVRDLPAEIPFEVELEKALPLPRLGTALAPGIPALTARQRERLAGLRLAHLRVDLVPSREDFDGVLARACTEAAALDVPLELALAVGEAAEDELRRVALALRRLRPAIARYLLLPLSGNVPSPQALRAARSLLTEPVAPIGGGPTTHFTELNRGRAGVEGLDLVAFPNSPQVHLDDEATMRENLAALPWIAETARAFAGTRPLVLSPVRLRPPVWPPPSEERAADARQGGAFVAAWTACHLGYAGRSGFDAVTYFQAAGPAGLMTDGVTLAYHALAEVAEFTGGEVLASRSRRPLAIDGVALRQGRRRRLLLANLTAAPQTVRLPDAFARAAVRRLNGAFADRATGDPEGFRAEAPSEEASGTLGLGPYELARLDASD